MAWSTGNLILFVRSLGGDRPSQSFVLPRPFLGQFHLWNFKVFFYKPVHSYNTSLWMGVPWMIYFENVIFTHSLQFLTFIIIKLAYGIINREKVDFTWNKTDIDLHFPLKCLEIKLQILTQIWCRHIFIPLTKGPTSYWICGSFPIPCFIMRDIGILEATSKV